MSKHKCNDCRFDNTVVLVDTCKRMLDNRKYNQYNNQVISGKIVVVSRDLNFQGECPYFEKKKPAIF